MLPTALEQPRARVLMSRHCCTRGLDRVGGSTELVGGDMRNYCSLAGGVGGVPPRSVQVAGRLHGMATRCPGLRHADLAARPCPDLLDRLTGPVVGGPYRLEQV